MAIVLLDTSTVLHIDTAVQSAIVRFDGCCTRCEWDFNNFHASMETVFLPVLAFFARVGELYIHARKKCFFIVFWFVQQMCAPRIVW